MITPSDLKYWWRSGSYSFMKNRSSSHTEIAEVDYLGTPLFYRTGTSDSTVIYRTLFKPEPKQEYQLPELSNPRVILDIGGYIGVTAVLLAKKYPEAQIYAVEPFIDNFELLKRNTEGLENVQCFHFGLSAENQEASLSYSDDPENFGGFSLFNKGIDPDKQVQIRLKSTEEFLKQNKIKEVDLIKIDTEGSEYQILTSFPKPVLSSAQWILGELHGERDFELLSYLSEWFDVEIKKDLGNRLSIFRAKQKAPEFS